MRHGRVPAILLAALFTCGLLHAATYEIAAGGNWYNTVNGAAAGDTILVHEGAPAPVSQHIDKLLTIANYPGESPALNGGGAWSGFRIWPAASGTTISGLTFSVSNGNQGTE